MVYKAVDSPEKKHCYAMISKRMDMALVELQENRIVIEIWPGDDSIRKDVERRLKNQRDEEEALRMMIVLEEQRRRRL